MSQGQRRDRPWSEALFLIVYSDMYDKGRVDSKEKNRYNEKLFKREYRALKESKKNAKIKQKRYVLLGYGVVSIGVLVFLYMCFLLVSTLLQRKDEYLKSGNIPKSISKEISGERVLPESISKKEFNGEISSVSALVFNPINGNIILEKNINEKRYVASLTKILSSMVIVERFNLKEVVEVSRENIPQDLDWQLGLQEGDRISVENILKAMLISSYNDVPFIIANAYPDGGYPAFISKMNMIARELRMYNSHFSNPSGLDEEENYSTALDIAQLVSSAKNYSQIMNIVGIESDNISWNRDSELITQRVKSTNELYGTNQNLKGFKTGITKLAGECFVGYYVYKNGNELITIVLGSEDRFKETAILERFGKSVL